MQRGKRPVFEILKILCKTLPRWLLFPSEESNGETLMSELKSIIRMTIPHVRTEKYYSTDNSECQNWKVLFDWQFHIYNEPDRQLAMHVKTEGIYFKLERKLNIFFSSKYHA